MTTARITYDSINIDLVYGVEDYRPMHRQEMTQARAASGIPEQINVYGHSELHLQLFIDEALRRQLATFWWSWARAGGQFSFALDYSKTANTTLDGSTSGAVVPLTATTGFAAGDEFLIIADGDNEREAGLIQSVSAGVSITATASLVQSFVSGDACRHADYWPAMMSMDDAFEPIFVGGDFYRLNFRWAEVLS